ncbi:DUF3047 domain-containing protein [Sedimenticola selenatireducens]|nr:DUF3047 domain-containing protein [Sedimenticola selenatireducens]
MMLKPTLAALLLTCSISALAMESQVNISDIAAEGLKGWQEHDFKGKTQYRVINLNGTPMISAHSDGTASGLYKEIRVDLQETPYLNWQWQIEQPLSGLNEQSKAGDDYSARVYVIMRSGLLPWRTRALNYVWSSGQPAGSDWPNAYTDRARMIAVRSATDRPGRLYSERRNIQEDFQRYFDTRVRYIDVIAIMTDTDNSGQQAHAYYGDIYFSK